MGIHTYATATEGIGGVLKLDPQHFRVDEISRYPAPRRDGPVLVLRVEALDIEQNELLRRLSGWLGLPLGKFGIAGTKDRRALSTQLISCPYVDLPAGGPHLSGVRLLESYRAEEGLFLGHLYGNAFDVMVSEVEVPLSQGQDRVRSTMEQLERFGGYPNFFGPQRFGEVRPVTHRVGRVLVLGSMAEAVETYLTLETEGEASDGKLARQSYRQHHDARRALTEFPLHLRFERLLLERLARGDSPERAFRALPRHLKSLFVHAYQSYLFNEYLSLRLKEGLPLVHPMPGDLLQRRGADGLTGDMPPVVVMPDNLPEAEAMIASGRAVVAAPLIGTDSPSLSGRPGELFRQVLEVEQVQPSDFHLSDVPRLSSHGALRPLLARLPYHFYRRTVEWTADGSPRFRFCLDKGCYATVLLREFLKPESS